LGVHRAGIGNQNLGDGTSRLTFVFTDRVCCEVILSIVAKSICHDVVNFYFLQTNEFFLGWVVIIFAEDIISRDQDASAIGESDTPLLLQLVGLEISNNFYKFD
jgi:hypothetical protein